MKNQLLLCLSCIMLFQIYSCTTSNVKCPSFAGRTSHHHPAHLFAHYKHTKPSKPENAPAEAAKKPVDSTALGDGLALGGGGSAFQLRIPKLFTKNIKNEEIEAANSELKANSANRVSLVKRGQKVIFKAKSKSDIPKLMKVLSHKHEGGGGGGIAITAGVFGIIAFLLAFGPYVGFLALACAIVAIILGIIGLGSSRPGWAIAGIVLGVLALVIALLFLFIIFVSFL